MRPTTPLPAAAGRITRRALPVRRDRRHPCAVLDARRADGPEKSGGILVFETADSKRAWTNPRNAIGPRARLRRSR